MVTTARKSGNENRTKKRRRKERRVKKEKESKGRQSWREGRKGVPFALSADQTFQDIESFLGLLTSESKIRVTTEEQAVSPRG